MREAATAVTRDLAHGSASPATDRAAVSLLVALAGTFLEADKLDHAEATLQRAVLTVQAGGYATSSDVVTLGQRLKQLERMRRP